MNDNNNNQKPTKQNNNIAKVKEPDRQVKHNTQLKSNNQSKENKSQVNTKLSIPNTQRQNNKNQPLPTASQEPPKPLQINNDVKQSQPNKNKEDEKKQQPIIEMPQPQNNDKPLEQLIILPIVINELPQKSMFVSVSQMNIKYIFKREEYSVKISSLKTLKHLRNIFSSKVKLPIEEIELFYQNKLIDKSMDKIQLNSFLKKKPYSYFEIRKKCNNSLLSCINEIYNSQAYEHKVNLQQYPSTIELSNHITNFFRETMQIKDIKIESINNNNAVLCFRSSALAFDFNRYLWFIKAQDTKWSQMTSSIQLPQPVKNVIQINQSRSPRNKTCKRERIIPMTMFYHGIQSYPYLSMEERRMIEYKESKKKWVSSKDFITSVGNYSMIQNKKYHPSI